MTWVTKPFIFWRTALLNLKQICDLNFRDLLNLKQENWMAKRKWFNDLRMTMFFWHPVHNKLHSITGNSKPDKHLAICVSRNTTEIEKTPNVILKNINFKTSSKPVLPSSYWKDYHIDFTKKKTLHPLVFKTVVTTTLKANWQNQSYFQSFSAILILLKIARYFPSGKDFLLPHSGLKITVGHRTMSDQNQNLSDQTKNTPDILTDGKNARQN